MRVQGFRGRGLPHGSGGGPNRGMRHYGGHYEQDRGHYDMTHGRSKPFRTHAQYDSDRGRYSSGHDDEHSSRKRTYSATGSSRYGQGRPGQDGGYYSVRSRNPTYQSSAWGDDRRYDERKRMRSTHDSYSEASSSRRHDDSYHYDRSEYQERRGYRDVHPRHGEREQRNYYSTSRHEDSHRERAESGSRYQEKHPLSHSQYLSQGRSYAQNTDYSHGPPSSQSSRGLGLRLRGRGRGMERGRGTVRILRRGGTTYFQSMKRLSTRTVFPFRRSVYGISSQIHRGLLLRRRALDNRRRLLLARSRRLRLRLKEDDGTDAEDDNEDDGDEGNKEKEKKKKAEEKEDDGEEDDEEVDAEETSETEGKTKEKKLKSEVSAVTDTRGEGDTGSVQVTIQQDQEGRAVNSEGEGAPTKIAGKKYIQLLCPHCKYKAVTFLEYNRHLNGKRHIMSMRSLTIRHKVTLSRMRTKQRQLQRELEKTKDDDGNLSEKSNFCRFCKLLFRESKQEHKASEMHKLLKKFLLPYCNICQLSFRAPMLYEKHMSSLFHIKKMASGDGKSVKKEGKENEQGNGEAAEQDEEFNPDNFMTLDSVGDVDEDEQNEQGDKTSGDGSKETTSRREARKKASSPIPQIDDEYVQKVEAFYCELCRRYLCRVEPLEKAVSQHCLTRAHIINFWVKGGEERSSKSDHGTKKRREESSPGNADEKGKSSKQEDADKVESKPAADGKEKKKTDAKEMEGQDAAGIEKVADNSDSEDKQLMNDDKLWDDVNKDLGDLLKEVDPGNSSDGGNEPGEPLKEADAEHGTDGANEQALDKSVDDDDEQGEQERWDRLKTSQKVAVPSGKTLEETDKLQHGAEEEMG